jgi:hypothetical protein
MKTMIVAAVLAAAITPAFGQQVVNDLPVTELTAKVNNNNQGQINGILTNTAGKRLMSVVITFALLDAEGVQVGTAMAAGAGIDSGRKWRFAAPVHSPAPFATFKLASIQGVTEQ